jgi:hypothetical protein
MNRIFSRALIAALGFGSAGLAHAVPLYFDFTGTITSTSPSAIEGTAVGVAVSGGFNLETDRFVRSPDDETPIVQFLDWQPVNPSEPLAFVNFAGRGLVVPSYGYSNYTSIDFIDNCQNAGSCIPGTFENFDIFSRTNDGEAENDFTGTLHSIHIGIIAFTDPGLDYFDGAAVDPYSVINLPLYRLMGYFDDFTETCILGHCTFEARQSIFSVDTVTRGVGPRQVPEPGTLGLLGTAIAGVFAIRRRKVLRSQKTV